MYNVYNASEVFYLYDIQNKKVSLIGKEKDFVDFLAKGYKGGYYCYDIWMPDEKYTFNTYFETFSCSPNEIDEFTKWQFFDGIGRCINPKLYEKEAYRLYLSKYKGKVKYNSKKWYKNKVYKGIFRRTPVERTGKNWFHYSGYRNVRYKHKIADFLIPEYRNYKRGDYVGGWDYAESRRHTEKSWKSQGKRRHQWEKR